VGKTFFGHLFIGFTLEENEMRLQTKKRSAEEVVQAEGRRRGGEEGKMCSE